jgi:Uncharacterized conserved protein
MDTMNIAEILGLSTEEIEELSDDEINALLEAIGNFGDDESRNLDLGIEPDPDADAEAVADLIVEIVADEPMSEEDVVILEEVVEELLDERAKRKKASKRSAKGAKSKRSRAAGRVAQNAGSRVVRTFGNANARNAEPKDPFASKHYRSAFVKHIAGRDADFTPEEKRAFTHTTGMTNAPVPHTMLNEIWENISQEHSILNDVFMMRSGTVIEIPVHTAIIAGKAKKVVEGTGNDAEENEFKMITLKGNDFSKHIDISYAMSLMSVPALDAYLVKELSDQMGSAMSDDAIDTIITGISAANKLTATGPLVFTNVTGLYAVLKHAPKKVVYVNNYTLYAQIASIVDDVNRPIFQQSMQPGVEGIMLGAEIHIEESVADNIILVGNPDKVPYNMIQDIMVENDRDIKNHVHTWAAYARGECTLSNDQSFGMITIS